MCRIIIAFFLLSFLARCGEADVAPPFNPLAENRKPKPPPKPQTNSRDNPQTSSGMTISPPAAVADPSGNTTRLPSIKVLRSNNNNTYIGAEDGSPKKVAPSQGNAPPCTHEAATLCHAVLAAAGTYADLQACLQQHWESLGAECKLYTHVATVCDFMAIREVCTSSSSRSSRSGGGSGTVASDKATQGSSASSFDDDDGGSRNRGSRIGTAAATSTSNARKTGADGADANHFGDASTPQLAADCVERVAAAHAVGRARVPQSFLNFSHAACASALRALPIQAGGNKRHLRDGMASDNDATTAGVSEDDALAGTTSKGGEEDDGQEKAPLPLTLPSMAAFAATWAQDQAESPAAEASLSAPRTASATSTATATLHPVAAEARTGPTSPATATVAVAVEAEGVASHGLNSPFDAADSTIGAVVNESGEAFTERGPAAKIRPPGLSRKETESTDVYLGAMHE